MVPKNIMFPKNNRSQKILGPKKKVANIRSQKIGRKSVEMYIIYHQSKYFLQTSHFWRHNIFWIFGIGNIEANLGDLLSLFTVLRIFGAIRCYFASILIEDPVFTSTANTQNN